MTAFLEVNHPVPCLHIMLQLVLLPQCHLPVVLFVDLYTPWNILGSGTPV